MKHDKNIIDQIAGVGLTRCICICNNVHHESGIEHTMKQDKNIIDQIGGECLLSRARILNRVLTGIYDDELRAFGLKATQLNLLVVVARSAPFGVSTLASVFTSTHQR